MNCHTCHINAENAVWCQGCYTQHCKKCWFNHHCGKLTTNDGKLVRVGDKLRHIDGNKNIYVVTEIIPTFARGGHCTGERSIYKSKLDGKRYILRPRLMLHAKE